MTNFQEAWSEFLFELRSRACGQFRRGEGFALLRERLDLAEEICREHFAL